MFRGNLPRGSTRLTAEIAIAYIRRGAATEPQGEGVMASDPASSGSATTNIERMMHYREQAAQFRQWATDETVPEARDGLLDMVRQYERLAKELEARIATQRPNVPSC